MGEASPRKQLREAKQRWKEARKVFKRAKKRLSPEIAGEIQSCLDSLAAACSARDLPTTQTHLGTLDDLSKHLLKHRKSAWREYAESIGLAVLFALTLRAFMVEAFQIPSGSMIPTLLVGDHLFVNKFVYGVRLPFTTYDIIRFGEPERGDVVVFIYPVDEVATQHTIRMIMDHIRTYHEVNGEYPDSLETVGMARQTDGWDRDYRYEVGEEGYHLLSAGMDGEFETPDDLDNFNAALRPNRAGCFQTENLDSAKDFIKRVIGLPGERVRMDDYTVYIDDRPIEREAHRTERYHRARSATERIGDTEYTVNYRTGMSGDFEEITVREGHIFVMGDNRDNSADSRCWGQVPIENVKGEALFIFWSKGGDGFLGNRWDRMFNGIE